MTAVKTAKKKSATAAKTKRSSKAKTEPKPKKTTALDGAAKVLGETGQPMTTKELVEAMAQKNYWASPNGATPHATLFGPSRARSTPKEGGALQEGRAREVHTRLAHRCTTSFATRPRVGASGRWSPDSSTEPLVRHTAHTSRSCAHLLDLDALGFAASKILPALDDHVAVGRVEFHQERPRPVCSAAISVDRCRRTGPARSRPRDEYCIARMANSTGFSVRWTMLCGLTFLTRHTSTALVGPRN